MHNVRAVVEALAQQEAAIAQQLLIVSRTYPQPHRALGLADDDTG